MIAHSPIIVSRRYSQLLPLLKKAAFSQCGAGQADWHVVHLLDVDIRVVNDWRPPAATWIYGSTNTIADAIRDNPCTAIGCRLSQDVTRGHAQSDKCCMPLRPALRSVV